MDVDQLLSTENASLSAWICIKRAQFIQSMERCAALDPVYRFDENDTASPNNLKRKHDNKASKFRLSRNQWFAILGVDSQYNLLLLQHSQCLGVFPTQCILLVKSKNKVYVFSTNFRVTKKYAVLQVIRAKRAPHVRHLNLPNDSKLPQMTQIDARVCCGPQGCSPTRKDCFQRKRFSTYHHADLVIFVLLGGLDSLVYDQIHEGVETAQNS